jgi:hypothetical protein
MLSFVFTDVPHDNPNVLQLKNLASKVLFALSLNFFNAVFNRISARSVAYNDEGVLGKLH